MRVGRGVCGLKTKNQFGAHMRDKRERIDEACLDRTRRPLLASADVYTNVKKRWVEQGIWNSKWDQLIGPMGQWKHEETARG